MPSRAFSDGCAERELDARTDLDFWWRRWASVWKVYQHPGAGWQGKRRTLVKVAWHWGQALDGKVNSGAVEGRAGSQAWHGMQFGGPLMALEVGLASELLVAAVDGAWPEPVARRLLPAVPDLPVRRRVLLLFQPLIGHMGWPADQRKNTHYSRRRWGYPSESCWRP